VYPSVVNILEPYHALARELKSVAVHCVSLVTLLCKSPDAQGVCLMNAVWQALFIVEFDLE